MVYSKWPSVEKVDEVDLSRQSSHTTNHQSQYVPPHQSLDCHEIDSLNEVGLIWFSLKKGIPLQTNIAIRLDYVYLMTMVRKLIVAWWDTSLLHNQFGKERNSF